MKVFIIVCIMQILCSIILLGLSYNMSDSYYNYLRSVSSDCSKECYKISKECGRSCLGCYIGCFEGFCAPICKGCGEACD